MGRSKERFKLYSLLRLWIFERGKRAQLKCTLLSSVRGWPNALTFHNHIIHIVRLLFMQSIICRRHTTTKVYLFPSVGTKEYFMTWFWLRWSPSRCMLHSVSYMCSLYTPSCRSCRSWMDAEQACTRWNSPFLTVISWWLCSLWWRCGDDVRDLYVPVWECTCSMCRGRRSLSEQLFIKGFHGDVLPNIAARGRENEVKPHLLQPWSAEYWLTGTFQVFGTK